MAVNDYSRRSVRLSNLSSGAKARTPILPDTMSGVDRTHAWERAYAREAQGWNAIAEGGAKIGQAVIALDAILQKRENDRVIARAAGMVMGINDRNLTGAEKDGGGAGQGLLNRTGEACLNLPQEGHESLAKTLGAVSEELELSDSQIEQLKDRLSPYAMSCMGRLRARQQSEMGRLQVADAEALWKRDVQTIADGNDGDAMYEAALRDYGSYLDLTGSSGNDRELKRQTFVRTLFAADVKRTVKGLGSEKDFDDAIRAAETNPASLFMGNEVLKREMKGEVGEELQTQLVKEMREERDRFVGRERHEKALEAERIKGGFINKELSMMGKDMPQTEWVAFYRECGNDPELRSASPETALQYLKAAERLDGAIRKGVTEHTEDSLSLRLTDLERRELNGEAELQGNKIAMEQAAIWRDYQEAASAGRLREGFAGSFLNRLKNRLTDQERTAMRTFYAAFGYHGDLSGDAEPSAKDRRDLAKERFLAPVDETVPLTSDVAKGRRLTGSQVFELGDTFLRELRTMGPEAYRPEVMKTMIGEIKARKMADDFGRNRDLLAFRMLNIQRNLKAGTFENERTDAEGSGAGSDGAGPEDD